MIGDTTSNYAIDIRGGLDGVKDTLYIMSRLVREFEKSPTIITLARQLTGGLVSKDWLGEIESLHSYVRDHIRYVMDPSHFEMVMTPERLLQEGSGDCDDKVTLLAALLESIGHPTRFVAVGFQPGELTHVLLETKVGNQWLPLETTEDVPPGWFPPNVENRFYVHN